MIRTDIPVWKKVIEDSRLQLTEEPGRERRPAQLLSLPRAWSRPPVPNLPREAGPLKLAGALFQIV
jgi:hypothetical protein